MASIYKLRIECGNCYSRNTFEIERGTLCNDAGLLCPNCNCCPTSEPFSVISDNSFGKHTVKKDQE